MTEEEWMKIAQEFHEKWNFKTCIGAMDEKHILIKPPPNSGSYYFNYKHSFSIVLLAIVDANYRFVYTDIGCNGRISDGGVYQNCNLARALEEKCLNIPEPTLLPGTQSLFPYVIVADDAFPLKEYIMKPFSQIGLTPERRIFNYRLSRARRVVENAFWNSGKPFQGVHDRNGISTRESRSDNYGMLYSTQFLAVPCKRLFCIHPTRIS